MNIYEPYSESSNGEAFLHLSRSYRDRIEGNLLSRILPLLALIFLFLNYGIKDPNILSWIAGGCIFILLCVMIVLNVKTGTDIYFKKGVIEMVTTRIYGERKESVRLNEVDFVAVEVYDEPRVSGAYYRLVLKNKKQILLLRISGLLNAGEERFTQINNQIKAMTQLEIKQEWKGV